MLIIAQEVSKYQDLFANIKNEFDKLFNEVTKKEEEFKEFLDIAQNLVDNYVNFEKQLETHQRMIH